jgi:hypothetical protein
MGAKKKYADLHDLLGAQTALNKDDRSFEEQMADLGVEVVKPKTEIEWYEINRAKRKGKFGLKDKVSVNSGGITLGGKVVEMIGTDSRIKVAIVKIKSPTGKEKLTFILKPAKNGLKIVKTRANSCRIGSRALMEWLESKGIKKGWYKLEKIDNDGYKAVGPVEKDK